MDKTALVWIGVILCGVWLVVTAPPDPQYTVSVHEPRGPSADVSPVAFENLSSDEQSLFVDSFDSPTHLSTSPEIHERYVEYEGETYVMSESEGETGPVRTLRIQFGWLLVAAGIVGVAYFHLSRKK